MPLALSQEGDCLEIIDVVKISQTFCSCSPFVRTIHYFKNYNRSPCLRKSYDPLKLHHNRFRFQNEFMRSGDTRNYIDKADVRKMLYIECVRCYQQLKITLYDEVVA